MTKSARIVCADEYEARKLASFVSAKKDGTAIVDAIVLVQGVEIVLRLKDKTSHSILLGDGTSMRALESILKDVLEKAARIDKARCGGNVVEITTAD